MSTNQRKKVTIEFISDNEIYKTIPLEGEDNPIAIRTRSRTKCTSATKLKDCTSTPTPRKSLRSKNTISNSAPSLEKTPSPKRTRSATKRSSKKVDECSPFICKVFKPGCSSKEGKVTPLKIKNTKTLSRNQTSSDESSSEDKTPKVVLSRSPFIKESQSSEDVFRSSPNKRKTSKKEKRTESLVDNCHTPKTPRLLNGNCLVTLGRTGSPNGISQNLSATPSTPRSRRALRFDGNNAVFSTPVTTRSKLKKEIQTMTKIEEDEFVEDDFKQLESDNSDFSIEDIESDSDNAESESDSSYKGTPEKRNRLHTLRKSVVSSPSSAYCITPQKTIVHQKMVTLDSEKYFEKKSSKSITSNNILSQLPLPKISESDLTEITSEMYVKHPQEIDHLMLKYKEQFNKWLLYLKEGFNLMLYGIGSKLEILKEFYDEKLGTSYVLRVNGFNSNFSMIEMIKVLTKDILQMNHCPANINEALSLAAKELKLNGLHIFIIINNIDGIALRGNKKQTILSKLAELPNIHIIATLDHVNAPLLWGNNKMSSFNFVWLDVTTFSSYATEISYQKSMGIDNLGSDSSLMTLNQLFKWQDQRTKEVFELIVKGYMDNKNKKNFKGVLTTDLLRSAQKNLSISSNSALMSTLKDFIKHGIIRLEHNYLKFSINPNVLHTFYNQHFNK